MKKRTKTIKKTETLLLNGVLLNKVSKVKKKRKYWRKDLTDLYEPLFQKTLKQHVLYNKIEDEDSLEEIKSKLKNMYKRDLIDIQKNKDYIEEEIVELKKVYEKKLLKTETNLYTKYGFNKNINDTIFHFTEFLMIIHKNGSSLELILKKNGNLNVYGKELFIWFSYLFEKDEDLIKMYDDLEEMTSLSKGVYDD